MTIPSCCPLFSCRRPEAFVETGLHIQYNARPYTGRGCRALLSTYSRFLPVVVFGIPPQRFRGIIPRNKSRRPETFVVSELVIYQTPLAPLSGSGAALSSFFLWCDFLGIPLSSLACNKPVRRLPCHCKITLYIVMPTPFLFYTLCQPLPAVGLPPGAKYMSD